MELKEFIMKQFLTEKQISEVKSSKQLLKPNY